MQSSYGVPEGQPQCKSSPPRKEIQDVALKESRALYVCVCVCVCEGERVQGREESFALNTRAYVLVRVCVCVHVCVVLLVRWKIIFKF